MASPERYSFGTFLLDVPERSLTAAGQPVPLTPKAFDLLVALVRRAGQLWTKHQLLHEVWPESFVEEGILSVHVSGLRKALGDSRASPRYIETVPRSGYRFVAAITDARPPAHPPRPPDVYERVGRGRAHLASASMSELPQAEEQFRAALTVDQAYAPAHAGLALVWCRRAELRLTPPGEAYALAKTAALRALAMDASCTDAQAAVAAVLFLSEWDWTGAEKAVTRALALNPAHTDALLTSGGLLEAHGCLPQGLDTKMRALEHEPLSPQVHLQIALSHWHQRRYDDAITWANKTLALDPHHLLAREFVAGAYLAKGDTDRHMAESLRHARDAGAPPAALEPLEHAYREGGRAGVVKLALQFLSAQPQPAPDFQLALLYGEAGELDAAFRHLDRAIEAHDPSLVYLGVAPQWDHLRPDGRFAARVARLGLADRAC